MKIVADVLHNTLSPVDGDIIQYFGDSIIICLPGEELKAEKIQFDAIKITDQESAPTTKKLSKQ